MVNLVRITPKNIRDRITEFENCIDDNCRRKTELYEYVKINGYKMSMVKLQHKNDIETLVNYAKNTFLRSGRGHIVYIIIEFENEVYVNLLVEGSDPSGGKYNHVEQNITTDERIMNMCYSFCDGIIDEKYIN